MGRLAGEYGYLDDEMMNRQKQDQTLDAIQGGLGMAGFLPGVGTLADIGNAGISAMRGRWGEAGMNLLYAIPGAGDLLSLGKAPKNTTQLLNGIEQAERGMKF